MKRHLLGPALLFACGGASPKIATMTTSQFVDPHSLANFRDVQITHVSLNLQVEFDKKRLAGSVKLDLQRKNPGAKKLVLDSDKLTISAAKDCDSGQSLAVSTGRAVPFLGSAVSVELQAQTKCIEVSYEVSPDAGALLWVSPQGTAGKKLPMLFTQSQAILARSWIPLQDSPSVRFTYDATITVPSGFLALMSAENPQAVQADGVYRFQMTQPIPSYLMALAVGDFAFRAIGPRTGVYSEPSVVDAAAREFEDVERMMETAEKLYGPYRWGRYDILVLPPSFPFGGMENPRLTFLTPTVITGDKALVSIIAHELAHSWSGNLVTNATWNDLWLNEGVTTYVERRLMEVLRNEEETDLQWFLGRKDLDNEIAEAGPQNAGTKLATTFGTDQNPDDMLADIPYEKGSLFLRTMEKTFGRETFDAFLRQRFDRLAFSSTDTKTFEADVKEQLYPQMPAAAQTFPLHAWLHEPGLPHGAATPESSRAKKLDDVAQNFLQKAALPDSSGWRTLDWVVFLRALPEKVSLDVLQKLEAANDLTSTKNAEIAMHWLPILVRADDRKALPAVEAFLSSVGRRRMVMPLYETMIKSGTFWRDQALRIFTAQSAGYHPVTRESVAALFQQKTK